MCESCQKHETWHLSCSTQMFWKKVKEKLNWEKRGSLKTNKTQVFRTAHKRLIMLSWDMF